MLINECINLLRIKLKTEDKVHVEILFTCVIYYISWYRLCELVDIRQVELGARANLSKSRDLENLSKSKCPYTVLILVFLHFCVGSII